MCLCECIGGVCVYISTSVLFMYTVQCFLITAHNVTPLKFQSVLCANL